VDFSPDGTVRARVATPASGNWIFNPDEKIEEILNKALDLLFWLISRSADPPGCGWPFGADPPNR
jgi:hypothetical protein